MVDGNFEYAYSMQAAVPEFTNFRAITGRLNLHQAEALGDISGLGNLEHLGQFQITFTPLSHLRGLANLRVVTADFRVGYMPMLTSMEGLERLQSVGGNLQIFGNERLTSLRGLSSLRRVGGNVQITGNTSLPQSEIDAFLDRIEVGGEVILINPGP